MKKSHKLSTSSATRYCAIGRVSSREQKNEGYSLAAQRRDIERHVAERNGVIVNYVEIDESAHCVDGRIKYRELLDDLRLKPGKYDVLLTHTVDRLLRNAEDFIELKKIGIKLEFVRESYSPNASGDLQLWLKVVLAQHYSQNLSEEVRKGFLEKMRRGGLPGHAPWGLKNFRDDKGRAYVDHDPETSSLYIKIMEEFETGKWPIDALRKILPSMHIFPGNGAKFFTRSNFYKLVHNSAHAGKVPDPDNPGQWIEAEWQPLISWDRWLRIQAIINGGKAPYEKREMPYAGGLIQCPCCKELFGKTSHITSEQVKKKLATTGEVKLYGFYRCTRCNCHFEDSDGTLQPHPKVRWNQEKMEQEIKAMLKSLVWDDPEVVDWFKLLVKKLHDKEESIRTQAFARLTKREKVLREKLDRLVELHLDGQIDKDMLAQKRVGVQAELDQIQAEIDGFRVQQEDFLELAMKCIELSQCLHDKWDTLIPSDREQILKNIVLNCWMFDASLKPEWRSPFDVIAKGASFENGRGEWI